MYDLMIDIETMGTDTDAVMIQLAACFFNRHTKQIHSEFQVCLDRESSKALGFKENQATVDWWAKQNQAVLQNILAQGIQVNDAMYKFCQFLAKNCPDHKKIQVWSHATFDFPIVQNYLKATGYPVFNYKGARDIRTLTDLAGLDLKNYNWNKKTHDALDDCHFQIDYCVDAINIIAAPKTTSGIERLRHAIREVHWYFTDRGADKSPEALQRSAMLSQVVAKAAEL